MFEAYKGAVRKADQAEQLQRRLKAKEDFIEMLKTAGRYIKPRSSYVNEHARPLCTRSCPQTLNSSVPVPLRT